MEPVSVSIRNISECIESEQCAQCNNGKLMNYQVYCRKCGNLNSGFNFQAFKAINSSEFLVHMQIIEEIELSCLDDTEHYEMLVGLHDGDDPLFCDRCGKKLL